MIAITLVTYLRQQGVELSVAGDRLRCNAPKGVLTPALLKNLAEHKEEILALLRASDDVRQGSPTITSTSELSFQVRPLPTSQSSILHISRDVELPLSFAQQRLWLRTQMEPHSPVYNIPLAMHLSGPLNVSALKRSINEIVRRHEVFRTVCSTRDGQPVLIILPTLEVPLPLVHLGDLPYSERQARMLKLVTAEAQRPFDFEHGPFLRAIYFQLDMAEHVLLLTTHHFVMDGWSVGLFLDDLVTLYQAFSIEQLSPLPELPIQYVDFAYWQRQWLPGEIQESQLTYWKQQLANAIPLLQLPTDHPRPKEVQTSHGASQFFTLSKQLTASLKVLSRRERATLFMTLLATFQTLLYRYTLREDIIVGTAISNRSRIETESLIGTFENDLVLRTNLAGNPTFRQLLGRVREVALGAFANQDVPFEMLLEELKPERDLSRTPLYQVMFLLRPPRVKPLGLPGLTVTQLEIDTGTAMFDLLLDMADTEEGLQGRLEYNTDLFEAETIRRMLNHYQTLLNGIVADPDQRLANLPLLTVPEQQLLTTWNATQVAFPSDLCMHQIFETQVERTPESVAVVCQGKKFTYRELNCRANRLAHILRKCGVGPEKIVALLGERDENLLIEILAVFKAGGAYLPLDPLYPPRRHQQIVMQSSCALVVTAKAFVPTIVQVLEGIPYELHPHVLYIEDTFQEEAMEENLPLLNLPHHLAYVIYTSGSTGSPKGAMLEHRGMLNHLYAKISALSMSEADIVAQTASQCFDISVWQFLAALLIGGQVHIFPDTVVHDPQQLLKQIEFNKVSILEMVPSLLRVQIETLMSSSAPHDYLASLRWLIPTGEALSPELCRKWLHFYPRIPLLNAYGPTECSDDVAHYLIDLPPAEEVVNMPIGRPIQNARLYILSAMLSPMPIGVPGELYVGGSCVGRGYLNQPDFTAAQFIPDPFSRESGARLYRTGDLARYLPDGTIEYLGRIDHQVKLRGFRIELGEIEAVLSQHPDVRQAFVLMWKDTPGSERLVAYIVPYQQETSVTQVSLAETLRHVLEDRLPAFMVPSDFVFLNTLPLTQNGKIDHRALPSPKRVQAEQRESCVTPRDIWELQVAQIWEELLHSQSIGVQDNFFELGGSSLLGMSLIAQIQKRFGRTISIAMLLQEPTIEHIASILRQQTPPDSWSPLVGIQTHGTRPPFFCIHPIGGNVICYADLAHHLGPDQPFYGLQAKGASEAFGINQEPLTEIESMASFYIEALRNVQPEGPYFLGGWSMGGVIAFEMAQQLLAQGQIVALLALIDTWAPGEFHPETDNDELELLATLFHEGAPLPIQDLQQLDADQRIGYVLEEARKNNRLPPDIGYSQALHLLQIQKMHIQIVRKYVPRSYPAPVTLFQSQKRREESVQDQRLSWNMLVTGGVSMYTISGDHWSMLHPPHVQELVTYLKECIARAVTSKTGPKDF